MECALENLRAALELSRAPWHHAEAAVGTPEPTIAPSRGHSSAADPYKVVFSLDFVSIMFGVLFVVRVLLFDWTCRITSTGMFISNTVEQQSSGATVP